MLSWIKNGSQHNNRNAHETLTEIMETESLIDIWRIRNENEKLFSWMRARPYTANRIDFALVSQGISSSILNSMYLPGIQSDHLAVFLSIDILKSDRGRGYWKFNNTLLKDVDFISFMNNILDISISESIYMDPIRRWLLLKKRISESSKSFAKEKSQTRNLVISQLSEKVLEMEYELAKNPSDHTAQLLLSTKNDLNDLNYEKSIGTIFHAKARWYEEGEVNTKYFMNLEKRRYNAKVCNCILTLDGDTVTDPDKILQLQHDYYKELYTSNPNVVFNMVNHTNICVDKKVQTEQNCPFTKEEIATALKGMKSSKTPGKDGLTPEFFKMFWGKIGNLFYQMAMEAYSNNLLPDEMCRGIINLIPKAGRDQRFLKNLRPITLLSTDYKILEKVIANHLMVSMDELISQDQKGFMPGRNISVNIRKIFDIMRFCQDEELETIILSLDFQKCFDKIEICAILGSLSYFGFSDYLISWVKILYQNFHAMVQNNGHFTKPFPVQKSVQQGGPASSVLFLICAEILAINLRSNSQIKGIPVNDITALLNQFADDMDIFMLADQNSLHQCLNCSQEFQAHTGFTVNYDKTQIYRIGSLKRSNAMFFTQEKLKWTNDSIEVLGVKIDHDDENVLRMNYQTIVPKVKNVLKSWSSRSLSLLGKVCIVNSLIASLFVYKMMVLPRIPDDIVQQVEASINLFLWNGARPKIPLHKLQLQKESGGVKLVNLVQKDKSLKIQWVRILQNDQSLAAVVYQLIQPDLKEKIWECNLRKGDVHLVLPRCKNAFWHDVLYAWCEYHECSPNPRNCQIIWCNSDIRVEDKPILFSKAVRKGLMHIGQLYDNGKLRSAFVLCNTFGLTIMELNSIIAAIPRSLKNQKNEPCILTCPKSSINYDRMTMDQNAMTAKCADWQKELGIDMDYVSFLLCFKELYSVTNVPKFRSFQLRLLHRALITNVHLEKWGMMESNMCTFCHKEKETYLHLFIYCQYARELWLKCEEYVDQYVNQDEVNFNPLSVITNRLIESNSRHVKNFICLIVKQYIYRKRCLKEMPNVNELINNILHIKNIEKYIATKNNRINRHLKKWLTHELGSPD